MEEPLQAVADQTTGQSAQALDERRQRALQLLSAQRQRFAQVESALASTSGDVAQRLASEFKQHDAEVDRASDALREKAEQLSLQEAELAADRAELASRQADLELSREQFERERLEFTEAIRLQREEIERKAADVEAAAAKARQAERTLAEAQQEQQLQLEQLARRRVRIDESQARLEKDLEELEARREQTRTQRRRVAQQLRSERADLIAEREALEQETNRVRLQLRRDREQLTTELAALEEARGQLEETRRQQTKLRGDQSAEVLTAQGEVQRLTTTLAQAQHAAAEATVNYGTLQREHDELRRQLNQVQTSAPTDQQWDELRGERDALAKRAKQLEQELSEAQQNAATSQSEAVDDLQRRFEMAIEDVRELKHRNAELEEGLAAYRSAGKPGTVGPVEQQDWESTKRRMMAELLDESAKQLNEEERLTVEGAIRITDEIVAQRDRELADLKQMLDQHADGRSTAAEAARRDAVTAEIFDQDELIKQERERLLALEDEWRQKLRQAEVEISVQRARLARDRAELDEQRQAIESDKADLAAQQFSSHPTTPGKPGKPARRWLDRLGLKENDS